MLRRVRGSSPSSLVTIASKHQRVDWVYLDSSHEYEHTVEELEILRHKTGLISGHDWHEDTSHEHHGVCKAVVEFCDRYGWRLKAADPWGQWLVRSPGTG
jgi:hypothetical protein